MALPEARVNRLAIANIPSATQLWLQFHCSPSVPFLLQCKNTIIVLTIFRCRVLMQVDTPVASPPTPPTWSNFMKRKHGTANQVSEADGIAMGKGHKVSFQQIRI